MSPLMVSGRTLEVFLEGGLDQFSTPGSTSAPQGPTDTIASRSLATRHATTLASLTTLEQRLSPTFRLKGTKHGTSPGHSVAGFDRKGL